jgi:hypothetical protein
VDGAPAETDLIRSRVVAFPAGRTEAYVRAAPSETAVDVVTTWPLLAGVAGVATTLDVKVTIDGDFDYPNNWSVSEVAVQVWPCGRAGEGRWIPIAELAPTSPVWKLLSEQILADPDRVFDRQGALTDAWQEAHFDR